MWRNAGRYRPSRRRQRAVNNQDPVEDRVEDREDRVDDECDAFSSEDETGIPMGIPEIPAETIKITRRKHAMGKLYAGPVQRCNDATYDESKCRNVASLQRLWQSHSSLASKIYPVALWRILGAVLGESKTTQTKVLQAVASILSAEEGKKWPLSRRALDAKVLQKAGTIIPRVQRAVEIDLGDLSSSFAILKKPIHFEFVDPVIAWALCANKLSKKHKLFFKYKSLHHPLNGELLDGASMQNGMMLKRACERLPTS